MDEKRKEEEARELTPEEIDETIFQEQIASGEYDEEVPEYYFSNPDPYAKVEPRPDDAPKRNFSFDENGNIIVKKSFCVLAARCENRGEHWRHRIHSNRQLRGHGNSRQKAQTHYGAERCR